MGGTLLTVAGAIIVLVRRGGAGKPTNSNKQGNSDRLESNHGEVVKH